MADKKLNEVPVVSDIYSEIRCRSARTDCENEYKYCQWNKWFHSTVLFSCVQK